MNTAALHDQAAFFDARIESLPPPPKKATRRFVPAAKRETLRFVPASDAPVTREKLRFVPHASKASRAAAPHEPGSMMRVGSIGIAALALVGSIFVTSSAPASQRLAPPAPEEPRADVAFATEVPAPVVTPAVVAPEPATAAQRVRRVAGGASSMAARAPAASRADDGVDEITDEPTIVAPIDGPRPNPF